MTGSEAEVGAAKRQEVGQPGGRGHAGRSGDNGKDQARAGESRGIASAHFEGEALNQAIVWE